MFVLRHLDLESPSYNTWRSAIMWWESVEGRMGESVEGRMGESVEGRMGECGG